MKRPTVENYFSILEDTLLATLLRPLDSPRRSRMVVYPDIKTQLTEEGVLLLGFEEFCRRLEAGTLWSARTQT